MKAVQFHLLIIFLCFLGMALKKVEQERDTAIAQRNAALQQAEELAKKLKELEPMGRVESMPEAFGEGW